MSKLCFIQTDKHSSLNDSLLQAGMLILEFDFILCASIVMVMLKSGTLWLSVMAVCKSTVTVQL